MILTDSIEIINEANKLSSNMVNASILHQSGYRLMIEICGQRINVSDQVFRNTFASILKLSEN